MERVVIQSFDFRTLKYLHEHYPNIKTAMLIEDDDKRSLEEQLQSLGFTPTIYSPNYSLLNPPVSLMIISPQLLQRILDRL